VQVATLDVLSQTGPAVDMQTVELLQTQAADPAGPVHTWLAPHATGDPYA
jgi:hypothetical protein